MIRFGHRVLQEFAISGLGSLDRKILCQILVGFARWNRIVISDFDHFNLSGDFSINDNVRISLNELSIFSAGKKLKKQHLESFYSLIECKLNPFLRYRYVSTGADFLNSEANQGIKIYLS